jgi:hypothetical protein
LYRASAYGVRVVNAWRVAERAFAGADPQEAW